MFLRCALFLRPASTLYLSSSLTKLLSLSGADLLLDGATDANKQVFNILCEQPETVAAYLVPRVRTVVARGNGGRYIKYLTLPRALARFIAAPLRANRYFDRQGELSSRPRLLTQEDLPCVVPVKYANPVIFRAGSLAMRYNCAAIVLRNPVCLHRQHCLPGRDRAHLRAPPTPHRAPRSRRRAPQPRAGRGVLPINGGVAADLCDVGGAVRGLSSRGASGWRFVPLSVHLCEQTRARQDAERVSV